MTPLPTGSVRRLVGRDAPLAVVSAHLVVDERAGDAFEAHTENPVERMFYASSVLHCLPVGRTEAPSAGTGTVMRPGTFRAYAEAAGFATVEILPIEHDLFRFYRLAG